MVCWDMGPSGTYKRLCAPVQIYIYIILYLSKDRVWHNIIISSTMLMRDSDATQSGGRQKEDK